MNSDKPLFGFLSSVRGGGRLVALVAVFILGIGMIILGRAGASDEVADATLSESVAQLCSMIEGVGECRVMLTESEEGEVLSAAILCDGGDRVEVRAALTDMISELFGIGTNRISIHKLAK